MQTRFTLIREVTDAWQWEAKQIADPAVKWPHRYEYAKQPFTVKLKEFWPLHRLMHVQKNVLPRLLHENDGFILQVRAACMPPMHRCEPSSMRVFQHASL